MLFACNTDARISDQIFDCELFVALFKNLYVFNHSVRVLAPHTNVCRKSEQNRAPDALCALVRLPVRHVAADAIEHVGAEQSACVKTLPTDNGDLSDV